MLACRAPRGGLLVAVLTVIGLLAPVTARADARRHERTRPPSTYVNPLAGTAASAPDFGTGGGAGNTFPGAVAPFGMLAWSPQTVPGTVNLGGGYSYVDHELSGFSLTHLSGAGCPVGGDISLLPTTRPVVASPAVPGSAALDPADDPAFSHAHERAQPGYYEVALDPGRRDAIDTALTATTRAGAGHFRFPATRRATVLINAGASANPDTAAAVWIDPATRMVTGSATSGRFCVQGNRYTVYFAARFDRRFRAHGTWTEQRLSPGSTRGADTPAGASPGPAQTGAYLTFDTRRDRTVAVRVGISYVSVAGALRNLRAEAGRRTFAAIRAGTTSAWNRALDRIRVSGGSRRDRRTFETALYHALLAPSVFSDVDGRYIGMDGRVHTVAPGHVQYANYSGWDIYRSEIPLLAMLDPARTADMAQSLVNDARQSGRLPKWPVANGQTDVMVGDSADPILADAAAFGAGGFDVRGALAAMTRGATRPGSRDGYVERPALRAYQQLGYVPSELNGNVVDATLNPAVPWGSVSTTLEYATDDFSIAQLAARVGGRPGVHRRFLARSRDWHNVFDRRLGIMAARSADGTFDPQATATSTADFVEGDAAQYTWMVPFDLHGLFARLGGPAAARHRLDAFFARLNAGPAATTAFLGNEPTLEAPWEYDWLRAPYRTQAVVRRALLTLYGPGPGGYPGNDDLGALSAWYVLGAIGLYPEIPGTPVLALSSPLFPRVALQLGDRRVTLSAPAARDANAYIHGLTIDGRPWRRPWIPFSALRAAHTLRYRLAARPDRRWGASRAVRPPSF